MSRESGSGCWVLDSYGPRDPARGAGPVSRKFTQLADVQLSSARAMLQEAHRKYRPGRTFADVPSRPLELQGQTIQGQLWLEVPIQTTPIPPDILATANQLGIRIRDVTGRVY